MVDDKHLKLPKHGVADSLRYLIAICGVAFVAISVAKEKPWRHVGPIVEKVLTKIDK